MTTETQDIPALGEVVRTKDGSLTLRHRSLDECYHSHSGASYESRELYLKSSGYLQSLTSPSDETIRVLDVGLGLGYNALATWDSWHSSSYRGNLEITSLEIDGALVLALLSGEGPWQTKWPEGWRDILSRFSKGKGDQFRLELHEDPCPEDKRIQGRCFLWNIVVGDAAGNGAPSPESGAWDFIWQDAFSPSKNPDLWTPQWFDGVAEVSSQGATLATYSCARIVKDALGEAGWKWQRITAPREEGLPEGAGSKKKHWLLATKP